MRLIFLLLPTFLLGCLPVFAQKKWEPKFGFQFQNGCSGRVISFGKDADPALWQSKKNEKPIFTFSASAFARFKFSEKFGLRLGAGISREGYQIKKKGFIFEMPEPTAPEKFQSQYLQYGLSLPVDFLRFWGNERRSFYVLGGFANNFRLFDLQKTTVHYFDGSKKTTRNLETTPSSRTHNFALRAGAGWDFSFKKWAIFFQPDAQLSVLSQSKTKVVFRRLYSAGLSCGAFF